MKKFILHLSLCLSALFLATGCQGGYDIRGTIVGVQYTNRMVFLCAPYTLQPIDSTVIRDGKFGFHVPGSSVTVYNLLLQGKSSDILPLDIPVVTGDGVAKVTMGDVFSIGGTPLNDRLKEFLLGTDTFFQDGLSGKYTSEQIRANFKRYLQEQVVENKSNIVSAYILQSYSNRFTEEEYAQLKQQLDKEVAATLN